MSKSLIVIFYYGYYLEEKPYFGKDMMFLSNDQYLNLLQLVFLISIIYKIFFILIENFLSPFNNYVSYSCHIFVHHGRGKAHSMSYGEMPTELMPLQGVDSL